MRPWIKAIAIASAVHASIYAMRWAVWFLDFGTPSQPSPHVIEADAMLSFSHWVLPPLVAAYCVPSKWLLTAVIVATANIVFIAILSHSQGWLYGSTFGAALGLAAAHYGMLLSKAARRA